MIFFIGYFIGIFIFYAVDALIRYGLGMAFGFKLLAFRFLNYQYEKRSDGFKKTKKPFMPLPIFAIGGISVPYKKERLYSCICEVVDCIAALIGGLLLFFNNDPSFGMWQGLLNAAGIGVLFFGIIKIFNLFVLLKENKLYTVIQNNRELLGRGKSYKDIPITLEDISLNDKNGNTNPLFKQSALVILYYKYFMLSDLNGMCTVAQLIERNKSINFNGNYLQSYFILIFHYSFCSPEPQRAMVLFNEAKSALYEDDDLNSLRVIACYKLYIEGNIEEASNLVARAFRMLEKEKNEFRFYRADLIVEEHVLNILKKVIDGEQNKLQT